MFESTIDYYSCETSMVLLVVLYSKPMVIVADLWTLDSSFMAQCLFLVSTSALFDPLIITEKCECFSLDLAVMLLLQWLMSLCNSAA